MQLYYDSTLITLHTPITLHYTTLITLHYTNYITLLHYTTYTRLQLQLQLQLQLHYITQHYAALITLHHNYNYNSTTLQLQLKLRYTTLHPAVVGEVTAATIATTPKNTTPTTFRSISGISLCHPCITPTHLSYRFPIFETSAAA